MGINLKKYFDFVRSNGITPYKVVKKIPEEYFKYLKIIIIEKGVYLDATKLVDYLEEKHQLKGKDLVDFQRKLRLINRRKTFEENPELQAGFEAWLAENEKTYRPEIKKINGLYSDLYREKSIIMGRISQARKYRPDDIEQVINNYKSRLAYIERETATKKKVRVMEMLSTKYLEPLYADLDILFEYQEKPYKTADSTVIIDPRLLYHYLAASVFNSSKKEDISDEERQKQANYLEKYKEYIADKIDENGNISYHYLRNIVTIQAQELTEYLGENQIKM